MVFGMVLEWFWYGFCKGFGMGFWNGFGMVSVWFWYGCGMVLVWFRCGCGMDLACFWHGFAMVLVWYVIGLICYGMYGFVWLCMVLHGLVLYGDTSVTQSITSEPNMEAW